MTTAQEAIRAKRRAGVKVLAGSIVGVVGLGWILAAAGLPTARTWVYVVATMVAPLPIAAALTVGRSRIPRKSLVKRFTSNLFDVAIISSMVTTLVIVAWQMYGRLAADPIDLPAGVKVAVIGLAFPT